MLDVDTLEERPDTDEACHDHADCDGQATGASGYRGAASGDIRNPLRADLFSMHLAGANRATVPDTERVRFAAARQRDLTTNHHDARVPVMRVVGVHLTCSQAAIEDLVAFTLEIGFELALVHDHVSDR